MSATRTEDPLLSAISSSAVDNPTYWKTNLKKVNTAKVLTNAKKKKVAEGNAYKDKFDAKCSNKKNKNIRMNALKHQLY